MSSSWSTQHSPVISKGRQTLACWRVADECDDDRTIAASRTRAGPGRCGRLACAAYWSVDQSARDVKGRGDVTRLSASDASFYQLENSATPLYVGSLSILRQPRAGLSYETVAGHRRTAVAEGAAIPAEGPRSHDAAGPAGLGRRPRFRHHLSRPALGAAVAGQRRTAPRADRPAGRTAAGQVAAALGDVPGGGPGQEPAGAVHQVAPGADQRHGRRRDQPRDRRSQPPSAAVRRRHLGAGPRAGQGAAAAGCGWRLGHPPAGPAEGRPQRGRSIC